MTMLCYENKQFYSHLTIFLDEMFSLSSYEIRFVFSLLHPNQTDWPSVCRSNLVVTVLESGFCFIPELVMVYATV